MNSFTINKSIYGKRIHKYDRYVGKKFKRIRKAGKQRKIFLSIVINFEPWTVHVMSNHKNTNVFQIKEQPFPFQIFIAEEIIRVFQ